KASLKAPGQLCHAQSPLDPGAIVKSVLDWIGSAVGTAFIYGCSVVLESNGVLPPARRIQNTGVHRSPPPRQLLLNGFSPLREIVLRQRTSCTCRRLTGSATPSRGLIQPEFVVICRQSCMTIGPQPIRHIHGQNRCHC